MPGIVDFDDALASVMPDAPTNKVDQILAELADDQAKKVRAALTRKTASGKFAISGALIAAALREIDHPVADSTVTAWRRANG